MKMALNHYLVGSKVVLIGSCATVDPLTANQTNTDPTSVTFIREEPDGTVTSYVRGVDAEVTHLAVGIDACTVSVTQHGREKWRYEAMGACEAAAEDVFQVDASML
jgi:hypothetical protein